MMPVSIHLSAREFAELGLSDGARGADPEALFRRVRSLGPHAVWLDGGRVPAHPHGRRWALAANPSTYWELPARASADPFKRWQSGLGSPRAIECRGAPPPFAPHWFGYFSYECGQFADRIPTPFADADAMPLAWWARYPAVMVGWVGGADAWVVADDAAAARRFLVALQDATPGEYGSAATAGPLRLMRSLDDYTSGVRHVLGLIAAGDLYQANVAVRLEARLAPDFDPAALFAAMVRQRAVPFGALLDLGPTAIVSASPECLAQWTADGRWVSFPIKGTRPRGETAESDARLARELSLDAKERAEHVMIVDLVRHDLGRVAIAGSLQVSELARLHSFVGVHHLTSAVTARSSCAPGEVVRALFPGGSVTGAPKVRATEVIAEVERRARGVYCGALGYADRRGGGALNLPIRTAVIGQGRLVTHAGGGIVSDSDPHREWAEVLLKAEGWAELLRVSILDEPPGTTASRDFESSAELEGRG